MTLFPAPPDTINPREWPDDAPLFAATVYLEAANEPAEVKLGVAWALWNKAQERRLPLRAILLQGATCAWRDWYGGMRAARLRGIDPEEWAACWRAVCAVLFGFLPDPTHGATHFVNERRAETAGLEPPEPERVVARLGALTFVRGT